MDDPLNARAVIAHSICEGLKGNCPVWLEALKEAMEKMEALDKILNDCGHAFSDEGNSTIQQDHIFIWIIFDELRGRLLITTEKFDKSMVLLRQAMQ